MNTTKPNGRLMGKFESGSVVLEVWRNSIKMRNGGAFAKDTVALKERYKTKDEWKTTSVSLKNALKASELLKKAWDKFESKENVVEGGG